MGAHKFSLCVSTLTPMISATCYLFFDQLRILNLELITPRECHIPANGCHGDITGLNFLYILTYSPFFRPSTFDEYAAEVRSGRLEWSPVHKSEKFWVNTAVYINQSNVV